MSDKLIKRYIIKRTTFTFDEVEIYASEPNDDLRIISLRIHNDGIHSITLSGLSAYVSDKDGFIIKLINNKECICKTLRFTIQSINQGGHEFTVNHFGYDGSNISFFYRCAMNIREYFTKNIFDYINYDEMIVSIIEPNIYGWN